MGREENRREELVSWSAFVREESHLLHERPYLLFQQAANRPASDPAGRAADRRASAGGALRPWLRRIPRPRWGSPVRLSIDAHRAPITACTVTTDGGRLVTASSQGAVTVWNGETGEATATAHLGSPVNACALSPDDARLAVACADGTVRLMDPATLEVHEVLDGHVGGATTVAFSPNGIRLAAGGADGRVRVREIDARREEWIDAHHHVGACSFSPDGGSLLIGEWYGHLRIHDVWTGRLEKWIEHAQLRDPSWIRVATYSLDGKRIAVSAFDIPVAGSPQRRAIVIYDAGTGAVERELHGHGNWVTACAFSPDGRHLASSSDDGTVILWDVTSGEHLGVLWHPAAVRTCAFVRDDTTLATGAGDGILRLWDVEAGIAPSRDTRHSAAVEAVALSGDGTLAVSVSFDRKARIWEVAAGSCRAVLELPRAIDACVLSPDGARLATGEHAQGDQAEGTLRLWDVDRAVELASLVGYPTGVRGGGSASAFAFSPDGTHLAAPAKGGDVAILDPDGRLEGRLSGHTGHVLAFAWSPDGRLLATASADGRVFLWVDPPSGEGSVVADDLGHAHRCAFSPDGRFLAIAALDKLRVVEVATRARILHTLEPYAIEWLTFTPDGSSLLCVRFDGHLKLRSAPSWEELRDQSAHAGPARAILPSGHLVASAGDDGWLKVWELESGEEAASLFLGGRPRVALSACCNILVAGAGDGSVRFLSIENGNEPRRR
jgi:WD40 repeat protein